MWVVTLALAPVWWMTFGPLSVSCLQNVKLPYVWLSLAMASVSNWKICLGRGKKMKKDTGVLSKTSGHLEVRPSRQGHDHWTYMENTAVKILSLKHPSPYIFPQWCTATFFCFESLKAQVKSG